MHHMGMCDSPQAGELRRMRSECVSLTQIHDIKTASEQINKRGN